MGGGGIEIEEAFAVHNPGLLNTFATKHANVTAQVEKDPGSFMSTSWKEAKDKKGVRKWTREVYEKLVSNFRWNKDLMVWVIPTIHGTSEEIARNIIQTGFVALSKLDSGYYGKGIYFTTSAEYGLPYYATKVNPTVLISLVISGNAYPVIEHPKLSKDSFMGAALVPGYHSHYVLTRKDGLPCREIVSDAAIEQYFDEIVIEQESSVLPFYLLRISTKNLGSLALQLQKEQERLRAEEQVFLENRTKRREFTKQSSVKEIEEIERTSTTATNEEQFTLLEQKKVSSSSSSSLGYEEIKNIDQV